MQTCIIPGSWVYLSTTFLEILKLLSEKGGMLCTAAATP